VSALPFASWHRVAEVLGYPLPYLRRIAAAAPRYYRRQERKKPGVDGAYRLVEPPREPLATLQRKILDRILYGVALPPWIMGVTKGSSTSQHASRHIQAPWLVEIDVRDYFLSVPTAGVFDALRHRIGCGTKSAKLLTALTTLHGHLPQGAPTSGYLAVLATLPVLEALREFAFGFELEMGVFVDGIAVSGHRAREFIAPAIEMLRASGLRVRRRKVTAQPSHRSQQIAGCVVNRKLAVPAQYRQKVRQSIFAAAKSGSAATSARALGQIEYVRSISKSQGEALERRAMALHKTQDDEVTWAALRSKSVEEVAHAASPRPVPSRSRSVEEIATREPVSPPPE
jgi:RNA-directed DNA polymerase